MKLNLYSVFHLNLAFSSIEEDLRSEVIQSCYWPLLRLIRKLNLPLGVEASGYTLEEINRIDPTWICEFKYVCCAGPAEFVGSGYSQLIGPLVPAEVNRQNQHLGLETYQRLLDVTPRLALVNEQAFSAGLVSHYYDAGYRGIIMEWDNPAQHHPAWPQELSYFPQYVVGTGGVELPLIWNRSLPFQQFQRYAHGEQSLKRYLLQLEKHFGSQGRCFPLYGNDAEIFDFRPGRFASEADRSAGEWQRVEKIYGSLQHDTRFSLISPSQVLDFFDYPEAGKRLSLESARQPLPVKKQPKYNINRWAVTGRNDLQINSRCQKIRRHLSGDFGTEEWRELCYLWSSDFRTHITADRWDGYLLRLERFEQQLGLDRESISFSRPQYCRDDLDPFIVTQRNRLLTIETDSLVVDLNLNRGLAIESFALRSEVDKPFLGTLPHGYFNNIELGADYYSGHLVAEIPGDHKVTDLVRVEPEFYMEGRKLLVAGTIETPFGPLEKRVVISADKASITLEYHFDWDNFPLATLHLGYITLSSNSYDRNSLFFATHNGGFEREVFSIDRQPIHHLAPVTPLVTAGHGLGVTEGVIELGDSDHSVEVSFDPGQAALTAHILHQPSPPDFLYRVIFSAREIDDTCAASRRIAAQIPPVIQFNITLKTTI